MSNQIILRGLDKVAYEREKKEFEKMKRVMRTLVRMADAICIEDVLDDQLMSDYITNKQHSDFWQAVKTADELINGKKF